MTVMHNVSQAAAWLACMVLLSACEGDARPFEEAVEVATLELESLQITAPDITVENLVLNTGETVQLGVQGIDTANTVINLSASDRDWRIENTDGTATTVATISGNGLLQAHNDGTAQVLVTIGGLLSPAYVVEVSNAALASLEAISGEATIERCRPAEYRLTGRYDDNSIRDLYDVSWTLADEDGSLARIEDETNTVGVVTALNTGAVTLTASAAGLSLPRPLEIADTLTGLVITPSPAGVDVGTTLDLEAAGTYTDDAGTTSIIITDSVSWTVNEAGKEFASVSNSGNTRGVVTGEAEGVATITASCGNDSVGVLLTVSDGTGSTADPLSFERDSPLVVPINTGYITLSVSTGSSFDASNVIDNDVLTWTVTDNSTTINRVIQLQPEGPDAGRFWPNAIGTATVTATHPDGGSATITIQVTNS